MKRINWKTFAEHMLTGAAIESGTSAIPRDRPNITVGLPVTALVAGFKEGSDATSGADTRKQAIFHALTILAGAGIGAWVWH